MTPLDKAYLDLLRCGFPMLQHCWHESDRDWMFQAIEFLHNVPSLIGETNALRHFDFWDRIRAVYLEWDDANPTDEHRSVRAGYRETFDLLLQPVGVQISRLRTA